MEIFFLCSLPPLPLSSLQSPRIKATAMAVICRRGYFPILPSYILQAEAAAASLLLPSSATAQDVNVEETETFPILFAPFPSGK